MATIIRAIKSSGDFAIMHKGFLQDPDLSAKAKGVMAYILSLPDDWQIFIDELVNHFKDGRESIRTAIKELEKAGYIERVRVKDDKGKFKGWEYRLYELPIHKREKPKSENPISGFPKSENHELLINNNTNNDLTNNDNNIIAEKFFSAENQKNNESEDKKTHSLKDKRENLTSEICPAKNSAEELLNDNGQKGTKKQSKGVVAVKEKSENGKSTINKILKLFASIFHDKTDLFLPQSEWKKIGGIVKKKYIPVMNEFATQEGWTEDDLLFRTAVIILYYMNQNKLSPAVIFGAPAETMAEIRRLQDTKNPAWKYKAFIEARNEAEKYLED